MLSAHTRVANVFPTPAAPWTSTVSPPATARSASARSRDATSGSTTRSDQVSSPTGQPAHDVGR